MKNMKYFKYIRVSMRLKMLNILGFISQEKVIHVKLRGKRRSVFQNQRFNKTAFRKYKKTEFLSFLQIQKQ